MYAVSLPFEKWCLHIVDGIENGKIKFSVKENVCSLGTVTIIFRV